jgi:23S rRNA pseudouridine2605 synthase/23S rRNA pseudouridine2604 synthase
MALIRLQKFLAQAGVCSRRKGEEFIRAGLVRVNGVTVTELGSKIDSRKDRVTFKGRAVRVKQERMYIVLNKPKGVVTSCRKHKDPIVLDLIPHHERVYPVGRLDKDSSGLVLLTNDGDLHQRLSHPSFNHEKEYLVETEKPIRDKDLAQLAKGVRLGSKRTRSAVVKRSSSRRFRIVLKEGRNRQIRRMVEQIGNHVVNLKRLRISHIRLGNLSEGQWRFLNDREQTVLRKDAASRPKRKSNIGRPNR